MAFMLNKGDVLNRPGFVEQAFPTFTDRLDSLKLILCHSHRFPFKCVNVRRDLLARLRLCILDYCLLFVHCRYCAVFMSRSILCCHEGPSSR